MHPELFKIPFTGGLSVKSYGVMIVIAFIAAVWVVKRLSKDITPNPNIITNGALYALIAGVLGSRLFYIIHYFDRFEGNIVSMFSFWNGGFELLGGVFSAIVVLWIFMRFHKLQVLKFFDILAISMMAALAFGRIGCFLSGCCFGKPAELPWAVRFPYGSDSYMSQIQPDLTRNRTEPYVRLPNDFFGFIDSKGIEHPDSLKPYEILTAEQKEYVANGAGRALAVHPTQLYSSANAAVCGLLLYFFWRRNKKCQADKKCSKLFAKSGSTFALMFIIYGIARFFIEFLRDDNPFEYEWWMIYKGGTISQNLAIYMFIAGIILIVLFQKTGKKNAVGGQK